MHNKTRHLETMKLQGLKTQTNQGRDEKVRMIMMQTWVETRHESNIVTTIKMHSHMTQTTMKHKSSAIHAGSCDVHQELLRGGLETKPQVLSSIFWVGSSLNCKPLWIKVSALWITNRSLDHSEPLIYDCCRWKVINVIIWYGRPSMDHWLNFIIEYYSIF